MATPSEEFFDEIARHGHEPLLEHVNGSVRVELVEGVCTEHWYIEVMNGDIMVTQDNAEADAAFRAERSLFDRAAAGEENLMAALLRGEVTGEGNLELIVMLERLMPGPPSSATQRRVSRGGSRPA